jgi:molybdopterin/thiamine biosynthesis adenylyltransferase
MNDQQLLRYSRHILLPEIGIEGQQKLLDAHALIVGVGGLGSPAALLLTASGVALTLCDGDTVDITNLQRQILHRTSSIGKAKTESAQAVLAEINPEVNIVALNERADEARLLDLAAQADVVLDCSDNFATRYALNRACVRLKKPLVSGAATRFDGQVAVFDLRHAHNPCYHCLYPEQAELEETRCAVMGVFAPLVGVIGAGESLTGKLLVMDALRMELRITKLGKDAHCPVCGPAVQK